MAGVLSRNRDHIETVEQRRSSLNNIARMDPLADNTPIEWQFTEARKSAGKVKQRLDQAIASKEANLACNDVSSDLFKEAKYYKLLADTYEANIKLMNCVVAYLNEATANGTLEDSQSDQYYSRLIDWLSRMETELRKVLQLPPSEISEMFETMRVRFANLMETVNKSVFTHPKKYAAAVGAMAGGLLLHKFFAEGCLTTSLFVKLGIAKCGCAAVGWGAAAATGTLGGVFLVLLGTCVYKAFHPDVVTVLEPETSAQFQDINLAVDNIKEALRNCQNDALEQDLRKIAAYWDHFNDFDAEIDTDECPVCLSNPPLQPVRFRGCVGRHFHCKGCREECIRKNVGGGICTICRHRPEN